MGVPVSAGSWHGERDSLWAAFCLIFPASLRPVPHHHLLSSQRLLLEPGPSAPGEAAGLGTRFWVKNRVKMVYSLSSLGQGGTELWQHPALCWAASLSVCPSALSQKTRSFLYT